MEEEINKIEANLLDENTLTDSLKCNEDNSENSVSDLVKFKEDNTETLLTDLVEFDDDNTENPEIDSNQLELDTLESNTVSNINLNKPFTEINLKSNSQSETHSEPQNLEGVNDLLESDLLETILESQINSDKNKSELKSHDVSINSSVLDNENNTTILSEPSIKNNKNDSLECENKVILDNDVADSNENNTTTLSEPSECFITHDESANTSDQSRTPLKPDESEDFNSSDESKLKIISFDESSILNSQNTSNKNDSLGCENIVTLDNDVADSSVLDSYNSTQDQISLKFKEENARLKKELLEASNDLESSRSDCLQLSEQLKNYQENSQEDLLLRNKLEDEIRNLKNQKNQLTSQETIFQRDFLKLQNESKNKIDQISFMYEECLKEKESMVVKYAQAENKNIVMEEKVNAAQSRTNEAMRDKENIIAKAKAIKADKNKLNEAYEKRTSELLATKREIERQKELVSSQEVKTRWTHNKLQAEIDAHKETKAKFEDACRKSKEIKEEADMIRKDCHAMIKKYQESEEIKSNSLDMRLKERETELIVKKQESTEQAAIFHSVKKELEELRISYSNLQADFNASKEKVNNLTTERQHQEETLIKYRQKQKDQQDQIDKMSSKLHSLKTVHQDLEEANQTVKLLTKETDELRSINSDLESDFDGCTGRESNLLNLIENTTKKNASLQSENNSLKTKIESLSFNLNDQLGKEKKLSVSLSQAETKLKELQITYDNEIEELTTLLKNKTLAVEELSQQVEDERDAIRSLKRKHLSNTKDLSRQLQQAQRKLETLEKSHTANADGIEMCSHSSSSNSLETLPVSSPSISDTQIHRTSSNQINGTKSQKIDEESTTAIEELEISKQVLIEKIIKLQRSLAKRNEKIDFIEDHNNQLLEEVQKKSKIIQSYVLREESGTLAPNSMDMNKVNLSRKGGIMASVYNSNIEDGSMTLDLSLNINHKLQAVLEDTLLKNITLKGNMETLGEEIARLSQENRNTHLKLQKMGLKL